MARNADIRLMNKFKRFRPYPTKKDIASLDDTLKKKLGMEGTAPSPPQVGSTLSDRRNALRNAGLRNIRPTRKNNRFPSFKQI